MGKGGIDQGSHLSFGDSFFIKKDLSGESLTAPEAKNWTLSSPLERAVNSDIWRAEPRDVRKAVLRTCSLRFLLSTPIKAVFSSTF